MKRHLMIVIMLGTACIAWSLEPWQIDSTAEWKQSMAESEGLAIEDGLVSPSGGSGSYRSVVKKLDRKTSLKSIRFEQSPLWLNWTAVERVIPKNLGDAPVALAIAPNNYWLFGLYRGGRKSSEAEPATLEGFDVPLKTTGYENQFDAPGAFSGANGGYHAWQSRDMENWVHHGAVTEKFSRWTTTAEYADGKLYIYYDFPNDQDPHLYLDDDLFDGRPGKNMGLAFKDPSDGSDCAIIRDLDGRFHIIYEDWSPINASTHAWDSPLAGHAVSDDGLSNFKILDPAVDERTKPTGKFAEYPHPHWAKEDPENFPVKPGKNRAYGKYEIHEPEQNAFGDWAAISIGGQYYLFCDFDPAGHKGREGMSVAWFTSPDINEQFTFCGNVGSGHPDPDIIFAEGQFYLITQTKNDFISPGPWVESVQARAGADTTGDGRIDQWTGWQEVRESYDYIPGFAKQVKRIPAEMDLSGLPAGYGFAFEFRAADTTENESKPLIDKVVLEF